MFWYRKPVEVRFSVPDRPILVPTKPLYKGKRLSFPGFNRPICGVSQPTSSSAKIKVRVEPILYSDSGPSLRLMG